jgi:4-amino-4-deoxy-L-arabinose transferase-like glycosyltransferase
MPANDNASNSFFSQLASQVLTSIPVVTALVFLVVSIKVFRVAHEETSTTVAIVRTADVIALLKGVILTLLPGFFAAGVAASLWWWASAIPDEGELTQDSAKRALVNPRAGLAWLLLGIACFTLPWPLFGAVRGDDAARSGSCSSGGRSRAPGSSRCTRC